MSIVAKTYNQILRAGTLASYQTLKTNDSLNDNILYFCTDVGKIFKGSVDFTDSVIPAATKPQSGIVDGKIYIFADTGTVETHKSTGWTVLSYPMVASTEEGDPGEEVDVSTIGASSTDMQVASAKNVYLAIQEAIDGLAESSDVVKTIAATAAADVSAGVSTEGKITYTTGDNQKHVVPLTGVVTTPTWNDTTRVLTIPVVGAAQDIEVNIGKDIFIDSSANNGYNATTGCIEIYLNDDETNPTKIEIPAAGLVDLYAGKQTTTVTTTLVQENIAAQGQDPVYRYKIQADVRLSSDEDNLIEIDSTNGGLLFKHDFSVYALGTDLATVDTRSQQNEADIAALAAVTSFIGNASTTNAWGSF